MTKLLLLLIIIVNCTLADQKMEIILQEIRDLKNDIKTLRIDMDKRFEMLQHSMDKRFEDMNTKFIIIATILGALIAIVPMYYNRREAEYRNKERSLIYSLLK